MSMCKIGKFIMSDKLLVVKMGTHALNDRLLGDRFKDTKLKPIDIFNTIVTAGKTIVKNAGTVVALVDNMRGYSIIAEIEINNRNKNMLTIKVITILNKTRIRVKKDTKIINVR